MDKENLVSIIVPTFNSERFIVQCIQSVLDQTYDNYEILIIDNNSIDGTIDLVKSFNSNKIKIFSIVNNGNVAISRNLGIDNSKGNWVAFLDSDDYWYKDKLFKLMNQKVEDFDLMFHNMDILKNDKFKIQKLRLTQINKKKYPSLMETLLEEGNPMFNSAVIVRKSILNKIGNISLDTVSHSMDYHTWLTVSKISNRFHAIDESLGVYRIHQYNLSNQVNQSYIYLDILNNFKKFISLKSYKKSHGYYSFIRMEELLNEKKKYEAFLQLIKVILKSKIKIKIKSVIKFFYFLIK